MTVIAEGTLEDGRRYALWEELRTFCSLGLRLWDAVTDRQVRDGLSVRAWPEAALRPVVEASRTRSDVYAFHTLPGLRRVERPPAAPPPPGWPETLAPLPPEDSPAERRPFVVEIRDPRRRYLPTAFRVELPLPDRGVFLTLTPGSPAAEPPPGFYLFSTPVRSLGPGVAAVRGELADAVTGRAAAHARVQVRIAGQPPRYGVADADGRFAVLFPLPPLPGGLPQLFSSPPGTGSPPGPPVAERTWQVALSVDWEPALLAPLAGTDLPEYRQVLRQGAAGVIVDATSPPAVPVAEWTGTLGWDGPLVVRSAGATKLWIVPAGSPA